MLESSLRALRQKCIEFKVRELAMPRIGCGLDKLAWPKVKTMLEDIFIGFDVQIFPLRKVSLKLPVSIHHTSLFILIYLTHLTYLW